MTEIREGYPKDVQHILTEVMLSIAEKQIEDAKHRYEAATTKPVIEEPTERGA